jgi:hypothetical protein
MCDKGRNAADAVLNLLRDFRADFEAHANRAQCPAHPGGDSPQALAGGSPR